MSGYLRLLSLVVVMSIAVAGSYVAGYMSATTRNSGLTAAPVTATATTVSGQPEQFKVFWEAWNLVQKEYYRPDMLDITKMTYGAIRGMLASLGDAHTSFATPEQSKISDDEIRGTFDGIGVTMSTMDNMIVVVSLSDGSPGMTAGIKPGDIIQQVDGQDVTNLTLSDVVTLVRGPRGTVVELGIRRDGEPNPLLIKVTRAEIKVETVQTKMFDDVAYVKITQFADPTSQLLADKLRGVMGNHPQALILDLRNNPGGLLSASVNVASQFMTDGVVLYQRSRDGQKQPYNVKSGGLATGIPMVVLVNGGSASASEIVAGALQDSGRAKLIGEPTYGKDTVQNVHHLSDHSTLRDSVAQWLTPKEQDIHEKGLQPDIPVMLTKEDAKAGRDPQLDRALQELQQSASVSYLPWLLYPILAPGAAAG